MPGIQPQGNDCSVSEDVARCAFRKAKRLGDLYWLFRTMRRIRGLRLTAPHSTNPAVRRELDRIEAVVFRYAKSNESSTASENAVDVLTVNCPFVSVHEDEDTETSGYLFVGDRSVSSCSVTSG